MSYCSWFRNPAITTWDGVIKLPTWTGEFTGFLPSTVDLQVFFAGTKNAWHLLVESLSPGATLASSRGPSWYAARPKCAMPLRRDRQGSSAANCRPFDFQNDSTIVVMSKFGGCGCCCCGCCCCCCCCCCDCCDCWLLKTQWCFFDKQFCWLLLQQTTYCKRLCFQHISDISPCDPATPPYCSVWERNS